MNEIVKMWPADVAKVLERIPERVREILRANPRAVLAGGVIRDVIAGGEVKDIDVFVPTKDQAYKLAKEIQGLNIWRQIPDPYIPEPKKSLNAYNVEVDGIPVQFVFYREFIDAEDLISQFDFLACCAGISFDPVAGEFRGVNVEGFYHDVQKRLLTFRFQVKDAGGLVPLRRALKLVAKGWKIKDRDVAGILHHWREDIEVDACAGAMGYSYGGKR
jgi:hypothetical protein